MKPGSPLTQAQRVASWNTATAWRVSGSLASPSWTRCQNSASTITELLAVHSPPSSLARMKRSTPGSRQDFVAMRAARRAPPTCTSIDK